MTKVKKLRHNEYYNIQETLDKLYADSQKGEKFHNLMEIISSPENIRLAYRNIKRNYGSNTYGTDNCTIKDIESIPTDKYVEIVQRKLNYYQPKPVRRVEIPKPNGKMRPLGIPTIIDRLVQQCNIDIQGFFDNVNHNKLINQIWNMGIRDKQLICIIRAMLKAPIVMQNGNTMRPTRGTPQGGILSPLLSNIVLNELDWWIASQWENFPTTNEYKRRTNQKGTIIKSHKYRGLRKSNLKEMYIVRYADDFKIFCRKRSDAEKVFIAVKLWLQDRLKLQISEEKSKVVNLKRHYSEFLGFKLKAIKKGNKYVVRSHMRDKAIEKATINLIEQIKKIQKPRDIKQSVLEIQKYNQMVEGIQNYYRYATDISIDCNRIHRIVSIKLKNRLNDRIGKQGIINSKHIKERYGKSQQLRFVDNIPLLPIGYVQTKNPMYKKKSICKYTESGRVEIHKNLQLDNYVIWVIKQLLYSYNHTDSIEFTDNKISLYTAQYGKCAILGTVLDIDKIHCHHKIPKSLGGNDNYQNVIIVHKDVHKLIHAVKAETIYKYLEVLNLNKGQIKKVNSLRKKAQLEPIEVA